MASDAPLKYHYLTLDMPFLDLPIFAVLKEYALEKSGLALKITKFKVWCNQTYLRG